MMLFSIDQLSIISNAVVTEDEVKGMIALCDLLYYNIIC